MTKRSRRRSSEELTFSKQIPSRKITDADVGRVAAAGKIPEKQLSELGRWLRCTVKHYDEVARPYDSALTKGQKQKSIGEIFVAARKLRGLLKQHWVWYMIGHEVLSLPSHNEDLYSNQLAEIKEQVERELSGVEALVNRSAAMLKKLELRPENADEKIKATGAAKPEIKVLHNLMRTYWMRLGRKPTFAEESRYVKFVRAVYGLMGLDDETSFETIRSRHRAALVK